MREETIERREVVDGKMRVLKARAIREEKCGAVGYSAFYYLLDDGRIMSEEGVNFMPDKIEVDGIIYNCFIYDVWRSIGNGKNRV